jgi:hypothetical protein
VVSECQIDQSDAMTLRTSRNLTAGMENNLQQQRYHSTVTPHQLNSALPSLPSVSPPRTERLISREDIIPEDIREMTIRNLDTGEVFVIGENDPDFEFDTFPLSAGVSFFKISPLTCSLQMASPPMDRSMRGIELCFIGSSRDHPLRELSQRMAEAAPWRR